MNKQQRAATNERLYCCRLLLDWYRQQVDSQVLSLRILEMACGESLRLHIMAAYSAYLVELSVTYNGPQEVFNNATQLNKTPIHCAELNELLVLEADDTWLSRLLCSKTSELVSPTSFPAGGGDISLLQSGSLQSSLSIDELQLCYHSLKKLIDTHRSHSEEW